MAYDRITLNNGLRIIGERMEAVHTVAVGVFVRTGAVNEAPAENGYSHFVAVSYTHLTLPTKRIV